MRGDMIAPGDVATRAGPSGRISGRAWKIAAGIVAGLVASLLLLLLAVRLFVDPNDYRDEMQAAFRQATGRELFITGPLSMKFFPWLAVATEDAVVGNRGGFGDEPFARLGHVQLRVRAWPLLVSQRLEFGPVEVSGLELNLAVAGDGRNNWSDLLDRDEARASPARGTGEVRDAGHGRTTEPTRSLDLSIASLELQKARVTFHDRQSGARYVISNIELETGALHPGAPVEVRTALAVRRNDRDLGRFELQTQLDATREGVLALVNTEGRFRFAPSRGAMAPVTLRASRIVLHSATGAVDADGIEATAGGATLLTSLHLRQGGDGPQLQGSFTVPGTNPRNLLEWLGAPAPSTRDPAVLRRFAAQGTVSYTQDDGLQVEPLSLVLDDTKLEGRIALADLDRGAVRFDLRVDSLDLDRYFAPPGKTPAAPPATPAATREPAFEALRQLDVEGTGTLDRLRLAGVDLRNVDVGLRARDGRIQVDPLRADAFGGRAASALTVDVRGSQPSVHLEQRLDGVDVAEMLGQLVNLRQVEGRGRAHLVLDSQGLGFDALFKGLRGTFDLTVEDGALLGADLGYEIERALDTARLRPPGAANTGRTDFSTLRGRGTVAERRLRNEQLEFVSDVATVRGRGDVDYGANRVDLDLTARLLKVPPGRMFGIKLSRVENVEIPMEVTGPIDAPTVRPDVNSLLQSLARNSLQPSVEEKVRHRLKGLLGL
jgi:AsmA protein